MQNRAVFLDLNGTLVEPVQVTAPDQYELIPNSAEAIHLLNEAGFLCPVITVQGRIERDLYTQEAFLDWFTTFQQGLKNQNAHLLGPYVCPHRQGTQCDCKKPQPLLYHQAAKKLNIDTKQSYVVGDTIGDIRAATAIGAKGCFVETGWAAKDIAAHGDEACFIGEDILAVAKWIIDDMVNKLQTTRCHLTALKKSDLGHMIALRTNEDVRRFLGGPATEETITTRFADMLKPKASTHQWAVRTKKDNAFIGLITLDPHHSGTDLEVSYEFLPQWWGNGYATETIGAVIDHAFNDLNLPRLLAETQMANTASRRLLERLGFALEQTVERFGAQQAIYAFSQ